MPGADDDVPSLKISRDVRKPWCLATSSDTDIKSKRFSCLWSSYTHLFHGGARSAMTTIMSGVVKPVDKSTVSAGAVMRDLATERQRVSVRY